MEDLCKDVLPQKRFSYSKRKICNQNGKIAAKQYQLQSPDYLSKPIGARNKRRLFNRIKILGNNQYITIRLQLLKRRLIMPALLSSALPRLIQDENTYATTMSNAKRVSIYSRIFRCIRIKIFRHPIQHREEITFPFSFSSHWLQANCHRLALPAAR